MKRNLIILGLWVPMVIMAYLAFKAAGERNAPTPVTPPGPDGKPDLCVPRQDGMTIVYSGDTNRDLWKANGTTTNQ